MVYVPGAVLAATSRVMVEVASEPEAGVTELGLKATEIGADIVPERATGDVKPFCDAMVTVALTLEPAGTEIDVGFTEMAKSGDCEGDVL